MIIVVMMCLLRLHPQLNNCFFFVFVFFKSFNSFAVLSDFQAFTNYHQSKAMFSFKDVCFWANCSWNNIFSSSSDTASFVGIFLLLSYDCPCCLVPYCLSIIFPPFLGRSVHIPSSIFPPLLLIKVNERVVVPMNFTCNMQPRPDETHRNNSALFFPIRDDFAVVNYISLSSKAG